MIATCPPDETLRRYLLGDFSDGEGSELETHLAECSACEETLSRFDDTHDSLLRHLPLAAGSSVGDESKTSGWLQRLMQGPPQPREDDPPGEEPTAGLVIEGLENYELTGVLGKGGMGVVYRAVHRQLNRPVAIKVIRPKLFSAAEARQRFAREIQILGGLNHPGIVAATDAGKIGPAAYLVMELIDGVDFSRLVHRSGPLAIGEGCEVARQIAAALAAVHEAGAIHRDIKPSNVMLDRAGRVKLLDFGLAHLAEPERDHPETSMGRLLGTLDYMAPEQADGDSVGTAADLYAIGATLYFLLTGRPPRGGEGQQTLLQQLKNLVQNEITPLSAARADVPPQLSELVTQLLAKDPTNRPRSAQEVAQRLAAWADRESVEQLCDRVPPTAEPEEGASASQSISQSLTELLGSQLAAQVEPHIEPEPETPLPLPKSRFRRVGGTLIALAAMAAALWAGFTLLIETPSGTIRIESDVAGVQVELLDEQEQTKTLEIKQGENRSELKAGRYRILIAGGHDHLSVTPDEITLQRGEERVARITQVDAEGEVVPTDAKGQPLYQGEPLEVWQRRFDSETDPLAKIEAGKALVSLARALPQEERFETLTSIGGKLLAEGWGEQGSLRYLLENSHSGSVDPTHWPVDPVKKLTFTWRDLLNLIDAQLLAYPPSDLAGYLTKSVAVDEPESARFAALIAGRSKTRSRIASDTQANDQILRGLKRVPAETSEDQHLDDVCLLIRTTYFDASSSQAQANLRAEMEERAKSKVAFDSIPGTPEYLEIWLERSMSLDLDSRLIAEVAFANLIGEWGYKPKPFRSPFYSGEFPYASNTMDHIRKSAEPLFEHWVALVTEELEREFAGLDSKTATQSQPEFRAKLAQVLPTLNYVLRARRPGDSWKTDQLADQLTRLLRDRFDGGELLPPDLTTDQILAYLVLCDAKLPAEAKEQPLSEALPEKLQTIRRLVTQETSSQEHEREIPHIRGSLQAAPYPTIATILSGTHLPEHSSLLELIDDASVVNRNRGYGVSPYPPVEPLLLLAIAADQTGVSETQDERIAKLLVEAHPARLLLRHLRDALSGEFVHHEIATRHLRKMKRLAKSEKLREAIEELAPGLEEAPGVEEKPIDEPAEVDHSGPEALYQGEPVSVWQRRFEAETDPLAKIEAGKALVSLARTLPEEERFSRIMWVGGKLVGDGWNTPALKLRSMRDANIPEGNRPQTSWPYDTDQTMFKEFLVFRNLAISQVVAEEPLSLAKRLTDHVAQGEPDEAWFAIKIFFHTPLEEHLHPGQPAVDWIVSRLRRPEDKDLNRVILLRCWRLHSIASQEIQDQYEQELISLGDEFLTAGLPSDQAWLGASWERTARFVGISPQFRAEVAFRQLIDHGIPPTVFNIALVVPDPADFEATTQMAGHWIQRTNRWLEEHQDQPDAERLANVIDALDYPLHIRPLNSKWEVDRTAELLTELLRASYEDQPGARQVRLEPLQLLDQIILCGAEIPEVAKNPPQTAKFRERLEAVRNFTDGTTPQGDVFDAFGSRQGIAPEYPYPALKVILAGDKRISVVIIRRLIASVESITGPRRFDDQKVPVTLDPVLLLAILTDLTSTSEHADERIAEFLEASSGGRGTSERGFASLLPYQKRWRNQTSPRATNEIVERYLRKMRQRTKSENLREVIDKLALGLEDAPEAEPDPKADPAIEAEEKPATPLAEVDHYGPEAEKRQIDSRLRTEVQFQALLEHDEMPSGLGTPGSIGERASHYERMKGGARLNVPDLGHWIELSNRWLGEHADEPNPERLSRVLEALTHALQMRPSQDVGNVQETARLLERRLADYYQWLGASSEEEKTPGSNPHDLLAAIALCGAEIPEIAKNPPLNDEDRRLLEYIRKMANDDMGQDVRENYQFLRGSARHYPYPAIEILMAGTSLPQRRQSVTSLINELLSLPGEIRATNRGQDRDLDYSPPPEPILLLAILADLTPAGEPADERIASLLTNPVRELRPADGYFIKTLSFHLQQDAERLPLATNEVVEGYLLQIKEKTKSEKVVEAIEKLAPVLDAEKDKNSLSMQEWADLLNEQSAEARRDLFNPPIEKLSAERLREGFAETAKEYRGRGNHVIADMLQ